MNESLLQASRALQARADSAWRWSRRHVLATASWARRQPRARLITLAVAAVSALLVAWLALEVLVWMLSTLAGGQAAPAPPPAVHHQPPPPWLSELQRAGVWRHIAEAVQAYAAQHSAAAGTPPWLLLAFWGGLGGFLLLGSWLARRRFGLATVAWCGWVAATAWVVWTQTPGADPVPAALAAASGITAGVVPLAAPMVLAVIAVGVVPPVA